ncbi:hypothetical protein POPTR_006G038000v4 [Populus trichocarpa]|uniref:Uncharacterized protein n=1 Tax=Populus trichocarpa TaxID=3694 RepID=U5G5T1_POPTR|nr:hypothetical protein BDE02_06G030800 [Populus trichocarpa]PNT29577.1 hypothetical protein POPTR_006G038000v4 [Populus trichocarpa]
MPRYYSTRSIMFMVVVTLILLMLPPVLPPLPPPPLCLLFVPVMIMSVLVMLALSPSFQDQLLCCMAPLL